MDLFLGKLYERSPTVEVRTVMTDDGGQYTDQHFISVHTYEWFLLILQTMLVGMLLSMCLDLTSNISFVDGT